MSDESYILKPTDAAAIVKLQDPGVIQRLLDNPTEVMAGAIYEYIKSGNGFLAGVGCRLVQGAFKGELFGRLGREVDALRAKGKLPDDFSTHKNGYTSWVELLTILDGDCPDEERLEALKAMFYAVHKINLSDRERVLNYQLFQIAKELKSSDLLVLRAIFESYQSDGYNTTSTNSLPLSIWLSRVSNRLALPTTGLILRAEPKLIEQNLISRRINSSDVRDDQQVVNEANARLTDLGIRFCETIPKYRIDLGEIENK